MEASVKKLRYTVIATTCLVMVLGLQACMAGKELSLGSADPTEVKGTYTLILYGCINAVDVANAAVLVDEKSGYTFDVYALDAMYKVKRDIPAVQALIEANTFFHCGAASVRETELRRIVDPAGKTIAYELKPFYKPLDLQESEVLRSSYVLKDGKVTASFSLDPAYQRKNDGGR
jgi:hypothetical protein